MNCPVEKERRPTILLMGPQPPPMGGIARYCHDIMASDLARRFNLLFLPTELSSHLQPTAHMDRTSDLLGILKRDGLRNVACQFWQGLRMALRMMRIIRKSRVELIHVPSCTGWGFWRNALYVGLARAMGVKCLWHVLGAIDLFWEEGNAWRRRIIRWALALGHGVIVQSDGLRDTVAGYTSRPVRAIYNGVDTGKFRPPDGYSHSDPADGIVRCVTVGALGRRKGHFDLLEVARVLCPKLHALRFVFVGGGETEALDGLIGRYGLSEKVRLAGPIDDAEMRSILHTSDIFALPSYAEGQPIAILEAMAAGLPIVATRVGSVGEVIAADCGRVVEPGDLAGLTEGIRELATSATLRRAMGAHSMEEAQLKYSVERTMREIGDVYTHLLKEERS